MNKLVEIRITDADENLNRVEKTLNQAANRKSEAEALSKDLQKLAFVDQSLTSFNTLITLCQGILADFKFSGELQQSSAVTLEGQVEQAERSLWSLKTQLKQLQSQAAKLAEKRVNGEQVNSHVSKTNDLLHKKRLSLKISRSIAENQGPDALG